MHDTLTDAQPITAPVPVVLAPPPAARRRHRRRGLGAGFWFVSAGLIVLAPVTGWMLGGELVGSEVVRPGTRTIELVRPTEPAPTTVAVRDPGALATTTTGGAVDEARGPVAPEAGPVASSSASSAETRDEPEPPPHTTPATEPATTVPPATTTSSTTTSSTTPPETQHSPVTTPPTISIP